jgi:uncharacterized protein YgbK (DUF1537 family)
MQLLLGCIADDITGASDMALMLAANGMPATLLMGVPAETAGLRTPAVVIAQKIRTVPAATAISRVSDCATWLLSRGARQLYYKYCSSFDSTAAGNIGPVCDALLELADSDFTALLPAFPENGRVVKDGILYVDGVPLSESPMQFHPLTPMRESSVPALMDAQTRSGATGLVTHHTVAEGSAAIAAKLQQLRSSGKRYAVIDAASSSDLQAIAAATADLKVLTGASGVAQAIPAQLAERGLLTLVTETPVLPELSGPAAVIAGSCSAATRSQVDAFMAGRNAIAVDALRLHKDEQESARLADAAIAAAAEGDVLVYSSASPDELQRAQSVLGVERAAALVESSLASIAVRLAESGVRKFVIAGGETSGAVAGALGVSELQVGPQIDPGVPWLLASQPHTICLAFKSGNFGGTDFFSKAIRMLP